MNNPMTNLPLQVGDRIRWAGLFANRNEFTKDGVVSRVFDSICFGPCIDVTFLWEFNGGWLSHTTREIGASDVERIEAAVTETP